MKIINILKKKANSKKLNNELNEKLKEEQSKYEKLNEEYKKSLEDNKNKNDKLYEDLKKQYDEVNNKLKQKIEEEKNNIEKLDKELKEVKNENEKLKKELKIKEEKNNKKQEKLLELDKRLEFDTNESNKYVHNGIKCKRCFMEPIIGYRYKCSKCKNYDLCQQCEEKNEISEEHPHYFIKINKEYKDGRDIIFNIPIKNKESLIPSHNSRLFISKNIYLYECLNTSQLSKEIYQGTKEAKIDIILKNNGNEIWPMNNAKLKIDEYSSTLTIDDIVLEPQKPGEQKNYCAIFKGLSGAAAGEYKSYLSFCVNNEFIGEKLALTVKIKNKDTMIEIEKNIDLINKMRKEYQISDKDFSNERLLLALKKYKNNLDSAFASLFTES